MRIGFDRQTFTLQKYGGISRYFSDLYLGLLEKPGIDAELLFRYHQNSYLMENGIGVELHPLAAKSYLKALSTVGFHMALSKKHDIHHSTYYLGRPQNINGKAKLVSTLYDMTPELFPKFFNRNPHANKLEWFKASELIISISDSSASDLAYLKPDLTNRIRRIHLYSGFTPSSAQERPTHMGERDKSYVLFIGKRGGYKNANMLIRAFANSEPNIHGQKIIFAGGGRFSSAELHTIDRLGIGGHVLQISVSDSELWYLYNNAKAVLVPSIAEGFSLPLVEGLVADIPVICSDIPVHREVAGKFATLINPMQHKDWAEVLKKTNGIASPSHMLGEESYKAKCQYFNRERMIQEHITAYRELLQN